MGYIVQCPYLLGLSHKESSGVGCVFIEKIMLIILMTEDEAQLVLRDGCRELMLPQERWTDVSYLRLFAKSTV